MYQRGKRQDARLNDPLNSPSTRGQHPHLIRAEQDHTGDARHMYETRDKLGQYGPLPQIDPTRAVARAPVESGLSFTSLLLALGVAGLAVYAIQQATQAKTEARMRRNPSEHPAPHGTVVVMQPALAALPPAGGTTGALTPADVEPAPQKRLVSVPQPDVQDAVFAPSSAPPQPAKKPRTRTTTQARDPVTGTYKPAGTRRRKITEGKKA